MRMREASRVVAVLVLGSLVACNGAADNPTDASVEKAGKGLDIGVTVHVVGSSGGTFLFHGGRVKLEVPPDALTKDITIQVLVEKNYPKDSGLVAGSVYDLLPDGATFAKAVKLSIAYEQARVPSGVKEAELRIHKVVNSAWKLVKGGVDDKTHVAWAQLDGFSKYGVKGPKPASVDGGADTVVPVDAAPDKAKADLAKPDLGKPDQAKTQCGGQPMGTACDDGNPCTSGDACDGKGACAGVLYSCAVDQCQSSSVCDGKGGCSISFKVKGVACNDAVACTKADACDGKGTCTGTPYTCSGGSCATNVCDGAGGCKIGHKAAGTACDDKKACTKNDACDGKGACAGKAYTCKPGLCTGACDGKGGCGAGFKAKSSACDDKRSCTLNDACDGAGTCMGTSIKSDHCLIVGLCIKDGTKHPSIKCHQCNAKISQTVWSPASKSCVIGGKCYNDGDTIPGGTCAICSSKTSSSSWTPVGDNCLIGGKCYKKYTQASGSKCLACSPAVSKVAWTGGCTIDGACHAAGRYKNGGCLCDPKKSTNSWTATATACVVDGLCIAGGAKENGGCGVCQASASKSSFTRPAGCAVALAWSKAFTGTASHHIYSEGRRVDADAKGNVYVTGAFRPNIDLGGKVHSKVSMEWVYVASYTPAGTYRWSAAFGDQKTYDEAGDIVVGHDGNVHVTGDYGEKIFVASYTSAGVARWTKTSSKANYGDSGVGIGADAKGNVYVTGNFIKNVDFGGGTLIAGSNNIFLASYDTTGKHRWSKAFSSSSDVVVGDLVADAAGNIYITGGFYKSIGLGGPVYSSAGSRDNLPRQLRQRGQTPLVHAPRPGPRRHGHRPGSGRGRQPLRHRLLER